ncbi:MULTISPECIES: NADH-quinone oxidoreductase subunit NuoN [unclassified Luteimonas]|uniref:NADH-quinone oxidoreductase subunit NuoN n=1 Tax=unclassified Luteimonas TaxID=2629088 RepID=UPI001601131A|nr:MULTISPECIES: NADH-quinone oxidoreductase subunit NuoN [unclassified Luteimonas]MBB1471797.1 NADH-quinone oxidoreductase subunit NuoN [Luteimonas sp. MC1782]MBB6599460.1 NADH-quinone oxidoreductase subunit NuoN [Luteimonas sp. MC1825]QOC87161.1 NADH-quinone oxidoreductase subunit NuoN [Luteimonas sp. MC1825]
MTPPIRTLADIAPLAPEFVVVLGAFALLMLDLFIGERRRVVTHVLAVLLLVVAAAMAFAGVGGQGTVLGGMFVRDPVADVLKTVLVLLSAASLVYAWSYMRERDLYKGELPVLVMFATAGMMLLVSAGNLTLVYVGLELLALCQYALVAIDRDSPVASEAGMKYFVLGALASGLLLYGMSLVYGATGTLDLATLRETAMGLEGGTATLLLTGTAFMVVGICFKFGAAPFHMWLPDAYHGAPTPITLFIGSAPKLAVFGMAYRLLEDGLGGGALQDQWQLLLAGIAALSLVVGNLFAIAQANLKRMLAYSTVSHVGFLLLGFAGGGVEGYAAAMFYAISYALMAAAGFGAIIVLSNRGFEADRIDDFRGLNARSPWMAALVLCIMASMAGVPPFLGFWAKLAVLRAALQGDLMWLAIVGIVFAVVGAFYYLRVIKVMYFDEPVGAPLEARADAPLRTLFAVNALALLVLGVYWNPVMAWCQAALAA